MNDYNAAERRHVRIAKRDARVVERQQEEFISHVMETIPGRQWTYDILTTCHVFASSHTGNALNTAFAEGERNIGLRLLNDIMRACPDQYVQMVREANARHTSADSRRGQSGRADPDGGDQGPVSIPGVDLDDPGDPDDYPGEAGSNFVDYGR